MDLRDARASKNAYIGSWKHFAFVFDLLSLSLSLSSQEGFWKNFVFVFVCVSFCLFVSIRLGHCNYQMISFQKIYGLYGLEHHLVETNGEGEGCHKCGQTDRQTDRHKDTRTDIQNIV